MDLFFEIDSKGGKEKCPILFCKFNQACSITFSRPARVGQPHTE